MAQAVFVFKSPYSCSDTVQMISDAAVDFGKIKKADGVQGYIKLRLKSLYKCEFYISRDVEDCNVRAVISGGGSDGFAYRRQPIDRVWDMFLRRLLNLNPSIDFGLAFSDNLSVAVAQNLSGDVQQVYTAHTSGGTSMVGFLIGGFAFGAPGAIVGGLSGTQHTQGRTHTQIANRVIMRAILSNGRITQGEVKTSSRIYQEIIVNMK